MFHFTRASSHNDGINVSTGQYALELCASSNVTTGTEDCTSSCHSRKNWRCREPDTFHRHFYLRSQIVFDYCGSAIFDGGDKCATPGTRDIDGTSWLVNGEDCMRRETFTSLLVYFFDEYFDIIYWVNDGIIRILGAQKLCQLALGQYRVTVTD